MNTVGTHFNKVDGSFYRPQPDSHKEQKLSFNYFPEEKAEFLNFTLKVDLFKTELAKIKNLISKVECEVFLLKKKEIKTELEYLLKNLCQAYATSQRSKEENNLFTETIKKIFVFNENFFNSTASINSKKAYFGIVEILPILSEFKLIAQIPEGLHIEIQLLHVRNLNYRMERRSILEEDYKKITHDLNEIVLIFSKFKEDSDRKGIHLLLKFILRINIFLFQRDLSVDVEPLMNVQTLEKFTLQKKVGMITQAHLTHFYFTQTSQLIKNARPGKPLGADDFGKLSEKYVQKLVSQLLAKGNSIKKEILHSIFSNLIWLSVYASTFLSHAEKIEREEELNKIFKKKTFYIPFTDFKNGEEVDVRSKININFLINMQVLIHQTLHDERAQISPFQEFESEQIDNLKAFLNLLYGSRQRTPKHMQEFVYDMKSHSNFTFEPGG